MDEGALGVGLLVLLDSMVVVEDSVSVVSLLLLVVLDSSVLVLDSAVDVGVSVVVTLPVPVYSNCLLQFFTLVSSIISKA